MLNQRPINWQLGRLILYSLLTQDLSECRNNYFVKTAQGQGIEKIKDLHGSTRQMNNIYYKVNICAGGNGRDSCTVRNYYNTIEYVAMLRLLGSRVL